LSCPVLIDRPTLISLSGLAPLLNTSAQNGCCR